MMPKGPNNYSGLYMIEKVDAVIITNREPESYMELARVLTDANWVNKLMTERSTPLSVARVEAAKKCTTKWVAQFDCDVNIPEDWLFKIQEGLEITEDVLAIDSVYTDTNKHILAYMKAASLFRKHESASTPYICNFLIRRSALQEYKPVPCFECEDNLLYAFVTKKGKWLHQKDIGVVHTLKWRNYSGIGKSLRQNKFFSKRKVITSIIARFGVAVIAGLYSRSPKTTFLHWKKNFEIMWGYIWG